MTDALLLESEKLARCWEGHEATWLRDYLVAGVEDPRVNLQSIFTRQFLIRAWVQNRLDDLMAQECRFAAVLDWLIRVARLEHDVEGRATVRHALRKGADNAEGLEIPWFVSETFATLPTEASGQTIHNYIDSFLTRAAIPGTKGQVPGAVLDTFCLIWNRALSRETPVRVPRGEESGARNDGTQFGDDSSASLPRPSSNPSSGTEPAPKFTLLEPACGSANDYRFLEAYGVARFFEYTGFDLCQKNIDNARALFPGVAFERGNVFEIAAPEETFDFCVVHDLFEHLSLCGLQQAVHEVCRVTRRGICAGFFQMDEIPDHVVRPRDEYYWNLLSLDRMKELFASYGFVGQAIHAGSFLSRRIGCPFTHNPNAYTLLLSTA